MSRASMFAAVAIGAVLIAAPLWAAEMTAAQRIDAIKTSLVTSKANLKAYQWHETTTIGLKGEVKSVKHAAALYGPDGKVVKTEINPAPPPQEQGGLRGRKIAKKKARLSAAMQSAVALIKTYTPPDPVRIQAAKAAGPITVGMQPGVAVVNIANYQKPGDKLSITVDLTTNRILGLAISSYLETPADAVNVDVKMGQPADGSVYAGNTLLNLPAQALAVQIQNTDYVRR